MSYKEYGYQSLEGTCAHKYLIPSLFLLVNLEKNKKILDIGCGNGFVAKELIKLGFNVYGIDASSEGIKIAKVSFPDRFFIGDINSKILPNEIKDIKFDTIISTEVIEHIYNPSSFFGFCKEILLNNGGGELILSTPYHGYLKNLFISILNKWDSHHTVLWEGGHIKFWSKATLSNALEQNGFIIDQFIGSGRIPYLWKSMIVRAKIK